MKTLYFRHNEDDNIIILCIMITNLIEFSSIFHWRFSLSRQYMITSKSFLCQLIDCLLTVSSDHCKLTVHDTCVFLGQFYLESFHYFCVQNRH